VVAVVAVIVIVGLSTSTKAAPRTPVPANLASAITTVPVATLAAAGTTLPANELTGPSTLSGSPLTHNGKPEILYIGAEFCPFCAAERWPLTVALSQFGTFGNLQQTRSAVRDGNLATLTYYTSTYSSPYVDFVSYEVYTNKPQGNSYVPLETPPADVQTLWANTLAQVTGSSTQTFPFVDVGGRYVFTTSQYSPENLSGLSFEQIASQVGNNSTQLGARIDASAAQLTKTICAATGDQPASVCSAVAKVPLSPPTQSSGSSSPATS
jgi:thiol-disulfide isomerase/thioredoxin